MDCRNTERCLRLTVLVAAFLIVTPPTLRAQQQAGDPADPPRAVTG